MTADCETTFKLWLGEHQGLICRVVRAYGNTLEDQDDLFQEICMQLWSSIPRFEAKAKVSTWIYRVALNTALVWNRNEKSRKRRRTRLASLRQIQQNHNSDKNREIIEHLYGAIRKLPKVDASVVLMHLDGLPYADMAEILGISESNIGVKLNRAKKQLALILDGLIDDF